MNDNIHIEEISEDICQVRSSNKDDAKIKDLLEKNVTLHEEVKKMKREQEIQ